MFNIQEPSPSNQQPILIGLRNCSVVGCQRPIQFPITNSFIHLSFTLSYPYTCFLYDQKEDYYKQWPETYRGCLYWSCKYHWKYHQAILIFPLFFTYRRHLPTSTFSRPMGHQMGRGLSLANCIMTCSAGVGHQNTKSITPLSQHVGIEKNKRCDLTFIKASSLIAPLLDDTELTSLSSCSLHLLYQILTSTYQLLNDTLPGCFRDCWFCVPPRPNL